MDGLKRVISAIHEKGFFREILTEGVEMFVGFMLLLGTPLMFFLWIGLCFNSLWWLFAFPVPFVWGGFWGVVFNKI